MRIALRWLLPLAQDLLDAMEQFSLQISTSTDSNGVSNRLVLNREQFMAADIWLTRQQLQQQSDGGRREREREEDSQHQTGNGGREYKCKQYKNRSTMYTV